MGRIAIIILMIQSNLIFGQISVNPTVDLQVTVDDFDQANLDDLKNSTTLFVYRKIDNEYLDDLKSALLEVWDYSKLKFISHQEYLENEYDESHSFFTINGNQSFKEHKESFHITFIYLSLWKKKNGETLNFCRIELFPTYITMQKVREGIQDEGDNKTMRYIYEKSFFRNWNLGYLKNALHFVNDKLTKSEEVALLKDEVYSNMSPLSIDTLFVPKYVIIKFGKFKGDETKRHDLDKIFKKYDYPYKIISSAELSKKIHSGTKPVYYLSYIKTSYRKIVTVIEGKSSEFIYTAYAGQSYNIHKRDLAKISREIDYAR